VKRRNPGAQKSCILVFKQGLGVRIKQRRVSSSVSFEYYCPSENESRIYFIAQRSAAVMAHLLHYKIYETRVARISRSHKSAFTLKTRARGRACIYIHVNICISGTAVTCRYHSSGMTSRYASVKHAGTKGGKETSRRIAERIREEQRIEEISSVSFVNEQ